ncbi:hypothetical protein NHP21005_20030 (plasmid) [Helicobacter sp. NHP21005]|uniref:hypothetical protein n=1 Tax=Helicobacter felistomachi TaxID=3040201 RepID=UPI0025725A3D|nr:hypothetical protein [Helicobacter sp. NHP21005]BEG58315.1 hypothetical protein NHP21005_20030 [Helicobacter sp. NHP21005]
MEEIMWNQEQKQTFQGLLQEFVTLIDEAVEEWEAKGKTPAPTAPKGACSALQKRINTFLERWGYVCTISPGFGNLANVPAIAFFRQNILGKRFVNSEKATPQKGFYIWFAYSRKAQPKIFDIYIGRADDGLGACKQCAAFKKLFNSDGYLLYGYEDCNLNTSMGEIADYFLNLVTVFSAIPQDDFRVTGHLKALEEMTDKEAPLAPPIEKIPMVKEHTHIKQQASPTLEIYEEYKNYKERDLHPLLAYFAFHKMGLYTKTIYHERSRKDKKHIYEWSHPDMVGVSFGHKNSNILESLNKPPIKIVSFELKKEIDLHNCRDYFSQAFHNSSWANEGYLVAGEIDQNDTELMNLLGRLARNFGIGVILFNMQDIDSSNILHKAKTKEDLKLECTLAADLYDINPDFKSFLEAIEAFKQNPDSSSLSIFDPIIEINKN